MRVGQQGIVTCDANLGEILVSCGVAGAGTIQGTYIDPGDPMTCIAGKRISSGTAYAVANCCVFPEDSIVDFGPIINEIQLTNNQVVTKCPSTTTLTGCVVSYDYRSEVINNIRGSYSGPQQAINTPPAQVGISGGIDTKNQCIAESRTKETTLRGGAQCLEMASNYELGIDYIYYIYIYIYDCLKIN